MLLEPYTSIRVHACSTAVQSNKPRRRWILLSVYRRKRTVAIHHLRYKPVVLKKLNSKSFTQNVKAYLISKHPPSSLYAAQSSLATASEQPLVPKPPLFLLFINLNLLRVREDVGVNGLINQLAPPTGDLQDEVVQGRSTENINVVGCSTCQCTAHWDYA